MFRARCAATGAAMNGPAGPESLRDIWSPEPTTSSSYYQSAAQARHFAPVGNVPQSLCGYSTSEELNLARRGGSVRFLFLKRVIYIGLVLNIPSSNS